MALILQVVAGILMLIGLGTLYSGTNPALLSLGNTIMIVGALFASAGFVLFGLAVVAGQVARLGARLDLLGDALAAGRRAEAGQAPLAPSALPRDVEAMAPLPPDLDLGLTEPPRSTTPPVAPPAAPVVLAPAAAPAVAPPAATTPVPPSRQSFGLPPLAGQAPFGAAATGIAAGAAAGVLAAGLGSSARSEPSLEERSAEKPVAPEPVSIESVVLEPVVREPANVQPVIPAIVVPDRAEPDLAHAVEDLKDEVKAAEADLAPSPAAAEETPDHLASLERILLGAATEGRAPATPEPEPLVLPPHREPEPVSDDQAEDDDTSAEEEPEAKAQAPAPEPDPVIATDDFMARLRETLARPVAPPEPAPTPDLTPEPADETRHAPKPSPVLSIEEELERALQASLAPANVPPAPAPAVEPEPVPAEPVRAAPEPQVSGRDGRPPDAMAALAKDFPELNDLLAPKAPPADPAASLLDDLKGIFADPRAAAPRQEPVVDAPAPPPPAPPSPPLLREGVIATIPFRLYGDGTIEADLAEGTTRFASLKDFRAHVGG
ncbi:hypothetical protein [Phreatobacter sp.]|uniref:hypothetical protein n=1 Tax=Phreatobacter sp. TaxID=1966341 RepID=UPI0022C2CE53|nr:hypothetical protein [Phreatobacter sp.]MCZ8314102.1 hypothetical protein [Phreatobacter sp.]